MIKPIMREVAEKLKINLPDNPKYVWKGKEFAVAKDGVLHCAFKKTGYKEEYLRIADFLYKKDAMKFVELMEGKDG